MPAPRSASIRRTTPHRNRSAAARSRPRPTCTASACCCTNCCSACGPTAVRRGARRRASTDRAQADGSVRAQRHATAAICAATSCILLKALEPDHSAAIRRPAPWPTTSSASRPSPVGAPAVAPVPGHHPAPPRRRAATALFHSASSPRSVAVAGERGARAVRANTVRDFIVTVFDAARAHLPREQRPTPEALVEQAQRQRRRQSRRGTTRGDVLRTLGESICRCRILPVPKRCSLKPRPGAGRGDRAASNARVLRADTIQRAGRNAEAMREAVRATR